MIIPIENYKPKRLTTHWFKPVATVMCKGEKALTDGALIFRHPPTWDYQLNIEAQADLDAKRNTADHDHTAKFLECPLLTKALFIEKTKTRFIAWFDQEIGIDGRYYDAILAHHPDATFYSSTELYLSTEGSRVRLLAFHSNDEIAGWVVPFLGITMPMVMEAA